MEYSKHRKAGDADESSDQKCQSGLASFRVGKFPFRSPREQCDPVRFERFPFSVSIAAQPGAEARPISGNGIMTDRADKIALANAPATDVEKAGITEPFGPLFHRVHFGHETNKIYGSARFAMNHDSGAHDPCGDDDLGGGFEGLR